MINKELLTIAEKACARAKKAGAKDAAASVRMKRNTKVVVRDGKLEEIKASVSRALSLRVFVDGRYGSHGTSDLGDEALGRFIDDAVGMTRLLMPDKYRALAEPKLYEGRSAADLKIHDDKHGELTVDQRKARAMALHAACRDTAGEALISAGAGLSDRVSDWVLVTSNGFADGDRSTLFAQYGDVSVKDPSGRRPSDWAESMARHGAGLDPPEQTGKAAAERALRQVGAEKMATVKLPIIVENRAVSRILGGFMRPLSGGLLDQKRSCFEGKLNKRVASKLLSVTDTPLLPGGWGSRRFDGEGITARTMPLLDHGVLKNYYIDTYYGRKLKRPPTTAWRSNLVFSSGKRDWQALCKAAGKAILVTRFIGGNSNDTTGDFSHGIAGYLVEGGKVARPLASMNLAGNHLSFWKTLVELGNDPYPHASTLTPSLMFSDILVSGK